ncbi:branched-chain amino acid ABC transporter permease [Papillibacter cinnamivorans]|uniref:Branched-chain amino acid transport system permease protein n=1 Tax=Papillibacter cinnamivorans DSM 12816 TaxID=1122930 RepID=A0A1W1YXC5_9FIRM|nr:branched-chain amino acid ABC transporter permease [Papillibacter cinnamivorans]SMC40849.1 branched-chain amino acid transport system permease protein [Papillibacter cinnamivorans DSM 12816]
MGKKNKTELWIALVAIALVYIVVIILEQTMSPGNILFTVLKKGAIYSLVAVSMNLLNGFTGLFSLGQAGFMLIGAYTYAILTMPVAVKLSDQVYKYYDCIIHFDTGILVGLICAGIAAAVFAALIGLPVLRLKSDYLAIATLGFAEIIRAIFQWNTLGPVTNGANVMREYKDLTSVVIPIINVRIPPTLFVFIVAGLCIAFIVLLINSSYGRAFKAIRDDEIAAEAMGINLFRHKQMSFVISSFFAGISGALLAMFQYTVVASQFKSAMTYEILLIVVIGGIGSISGSCIASFLYIALSEWWLRGLDMGKFLGIDAPGIFRSGFRRFIFSIIIMVIVLFFSRGLMGDKELSFRWLAKKLRRKRSGEAAAKGGGPNA